jgi:hypothetical protein
MLKGMRKHAKYFYVLFFIVIFTFIFWGIGKVDKDTEKGIIADVGKYKIANDEYSRTYERAYRFYKEIYKDKFNEEMEKKLNLKEKVLESMIDDDVLLIGAKEAGIKISDEELRESIVQDPSFARNGVFDQEIYLNRLRLNRLTPEAFENLMRHELIIRKMKRLIALSVDAPEIDLNSEKVSGDNQNAKMLYEQIINSIREKAVKSYIEGLKKQIKIKINKDLIT